MVIRGGRSGCRFGAPERLIRWILWAAPARRTRSAAADPASGEGRSAASVYPLGAAAGAGWANRRKFAQTWANTAWNG